MKRLKDNVGMHINDGGLLRHGASCIAAKGVIVMRTAKLSNPSICLSGRLRSIAMNPQARHCQHAVGDDRLKRQQKWARAYNRPMISLRHKR